VKKGNTWRTECLYFCNNEHKSIYNQKRYGDSIHYINHGSTVLAAVLPSGEILYRANTITPSPEQAEVIEMALLPLLPVKVIPDFNLFKGFHAYFRLGEHDLKGAETKASSLDELLKNIVESVNSKKVPTM
jgi:hypothetical protein